MKNVYLHKNGFSLVEMLLYMGLLSVLLAVVARIFVAIVDVQLSSETTGYVEEDSRYMYTRLAYDIRRASQIVTPAVNGGVSDVLTIVIDGNTVSYTLGQGNFMMGIDQLNSIGTTISGVSFTRIGNTIKMTYTVTGTTQLVSGVETKTVETTFAL